MSATFIETPPVNQAPRAGKSVATLPLDRSRGMSGMALVVTTEAFLFISLFFAYFYLANGKERWKTEEPPKLHYALIMLVVLMLSSLVLMWGEKQVKQGRQGAGRVAVAITILIGLGFMVLQTLEYREHWPTLTPTTDSYGSIFYAITSFHALHVIAGLLILGYLLVLPRYGPAHEAPYLPYRAGAMYWHFVDVVWIFVVAILYVAPHF